MSRSSRAGLLVLGVLSPGDCAAPLITDGQHPPMSIALIGSALGVVSIVLAVLAWRGRTPAALGLIAIRLLSALTAIPAFTMSGIPVVPKVLAAVLITGTVVGAVLTLSGIRRLAPADVR
jgi:hypothetical protein